MRAVTTVPWEHESREGRVFGGWRATCDAISVGATCAFSLWSQRGLCHPNSRHHGHRVPSRADDNKMLTLVSNERIPLSAAMRMVFEVNSLANATPGASAGAADVDGAAARPSPRRAGTTHPLPTAAHYALFTPAAPLPPPM